MATGTGLFGREVTVGLGVQLLVLASLAVSVRLGIAGCVAGTAYGLATWAILTNALRRSRGRSFGAANGVTLARATLVGGVTALVVNAVGGRTPLAVLITIATVALILDCVDGQVARRTGTVSKLGARFDMEVDAFLILVLSVFVARSFGVWVLAIGAMRYVFVVVTWMMPRLRGPVPPKMIKKTIAVQQGVTLVVAGTGLVPHTVMTAAIALALAMLVWSFGHDAVWLWRGRFRTTRWLVPGVAVEESEESETVRAG